MLPIFNIHAINMHVLLSTFKKLYDLIHRYSTLITLNKKTPVVCKQTCLPPSLDKHYRVHQNYESYTYKFLCI